MVHRNCSGCSFTSPSKVPFHGLQVDRLMDMIVHSLYSSRDIFLRELVSNASDALDKTRILGLTEADKVYSTGQDLEIRIKADPEKKTITIE